MRGSTGNNATGPKLAIKTPTALALAKEAQEMEAKLEELRKAMERERGMRQKSSEGPRWRNGGSGLLRGQFRSKQAAGASSPASSASSPASASPSRLSARAAAPGPPAGNGADTLAQQPVLASSRLSSDAPAGAIHARVVPAPGGLRVSHSRRRAAMAGAPEVLRVHSQQDLARSSDQSRHSATHSQAGDEPGLNEGAFDEAESHRSFMEALNEWRAGNRAQSAAGQQQQQQQQPQQCAGEEQALPQAERPQLQPPKYGLRQLKQQAGGPAAGQADAGMSSEVAAGIQTEPPPPPSQRPGSARQLSYFDRLVLSSASRQAGQAASGAGRVEPETRIRDAGPSSPRSPHPLSPHQQLPPLSAASSFSSSPNHVSYLGQPSTHAQPQGAGSPHLHHTQPHHSQQAAPHRRHPSSSSFSSEVYSLDCALNPSLAGAGPSPKQHKHKGLDILEELERLELQRHKASQRYDSDEEAQGGGGGQQGDQDTIVVTTQVGMLGLTKGVRLPDAIWVPQDEVDQLSQPPHQHQQRPSSSVQQQHRLPSHPS